MASDRFHVYSTYVTAVLTWGRQCLSTLIKRWPRTLFASQRLRFASVGRPVKRSFISSRDVTTVKQSNLNLSLLNSSIVHVKSRPLSDSRRGNDGTEQPRMVAGPRLGSFAKDGLRDEEGAGQFEPGRREGHGRLREPVQRQEVQGVVSATRLWRSR